MTPEAVDARLADALPPGALYAVGGRVRDEIRSRLDGIARPPKDLDYVATGLDLEELTRRLAAVGRVDVVGASFAVVKVTLEARTVDVALPRRERSTGPEHRDFAVEFGPEVPLEEDLARRDFRMNMIARRLVDDAVIDPFDGRGDIEARRIDLLRVEAFAEDPLRMLRAAQFAARFAYEPTPRTMDAMRAAAPLAATVSPERTRDELVKLLEGAKRPSIGLELLRLGGVLAVVLPELLEGFGVEQNVYHAYDVYHHALVTLDATPPDLRLRLAALFHDVGKPRVKDGPHFYRHEEVGAEMVRSIFGRLHVSNELTDHVGRLVRHHMYTNDPAQSDAAVRRFIRRIGLELLEPQFALRAADVTGSGLPPRGDHNVRFEARVAAELERAVALSVADLAVNGRDVIETIAQISGEASQRGSPLVGRLLAELLEAVTDMPALNERETLLAELQRRARLHLA